MIISNCNTLDHTVCGCTPSFSSYVASSTSVLDVGTLLGGSCTFTSYVIDWYKDGDYVFTSGTLGSAPDVTAIHPFTGAAAIPVAGGLWTPVIRWVVISGQKIYSIPTKCKTWCNTLTGLPSITVSSIYCGLVGTGANAPATYYDFALKYTSSQDYSYATRSIIYDLNSNIINFSYIFTGYSIADRVTMYHSQNLSNPIVDCIIGNDVTSQLNNMPYGIKLSTAFKQTVALPTFTPGSYLNIKVTPSVVTATPATDWRLDMKCLDASVTFNYNLLPQNCWEYDIDGITVAFNSSTCRYTATMPFGCTLPNSTTYSTNNLAKYCGLTVSGATPTGNTISSVITSTASYPTSSRTKTGAGTKMTCYGDVSINKTGNIYTITCDSSLDYNDFKSGYDFLQTDVWKTAWVNDPSVKDYYRMYTCTFYNSPIVCGQDGELTYSLYFWINAGFTFDPSSKSITINCVQITNGYPTSSDPCNQAWSNMEATKNSINSTATRTDYSHVTKCRAKYPLGVGAYFNTLFFGSNANNTGIYISLPSAFSTLQPMTPNKFAYVTVGFTGPAQYSYTYVPAAFRFEITSTRNSSTGDWLKDPLQNYAIYWIVDPSIGTWLPNDWTRKILQVTDGLVVTRVPWQNLV